MAEIAAADHSTASAKTIPTNTGYIPSVDFGVLCHWEDENISELQTNDDHSHSLTRLSIGDKVEIICK